MAEQSVEHYSFHGEILEDVSIDNNFAYCVSVLRISTFSSRPVKLRYDEFSPKTRSG